MKSVLLPLTAHVDLAPVSEFTARFSKKHSATITALYVEPDPRTAIPFVGEGLSADIIQSVQEAAEQENDEHEKFCKEQFAEIMKSHSIAKKNGDDILPNSHYRWKTLVGEISDHIGRKARTADVSICMQPSDKHECYKHLFNDLIYRSGRPVLMIPTEGNFEVGTNILIAWNGRAEVARSIANALPILRTAGKISIVQVDEIDEDRPSLYEAAEYLEDHGLTVSIIEQPQSNAGISDTILATAQDIQADLIVIGAYSHARWHEIILGSITTQIVANTKLPVFMSH
ncbi:universal stress protein [Kordiimonas sp. SCSIO 12603]|uniref:universal stress protein n=1 Tax=Kordiimonas sp. SCSIO 12603 TaxID=2829596 RepID=UPI0021038915|nr:universal stress protein [Kordiimonas sp. SCSIO 12603]UTW58056.1 universal stress protein [Kordiimonas sp. SCSIO 12603]